MIGFGILGYLMKKTGFEPGPLVLAFVLGSLLESSFRRSMLIFDGDPTGFITRPISGTILALIAMVILLSDLQAGVQAPGLDPHRQQRPHRSGSRRPMTVLIGYVPTPLGEAALAAGLAEAAARGDDVVILNSPRKGSTVDANLVDSSVLLAAASAAGVEARVDQTEHGADIVDAFTALIEETGARLVVIGMRRRSPVGKLMMGSDAQRLLLTLDVPILAVKPAR